VVAVSLAVIAQRQPFQRGDYVGLAINLILLLIFACKTRSRIAIRRAFTEAAVNAQRAADAGGLTNR